jgi:hypothetical protein
MSNQPRDEGGRFGEKITDQDILLAFDDADAPVLTTAEVHETVTETTGAVVSKKAVYHRLESLHGQEKVGKKTTGANAVAWWAEVAPRLADDVAADVDDRRENDEFVSLSR